MKTEAEKEMSARKSKAGLAKVLASRNALIGKTDRSQHEEQLEKLEEQGLLDPSQLDNRWKQTGKATDILERGEEILGVVVTRFLHKRDIVVKPLEGGIEEVPGFEGATVLGDGRVVLILSPADLIRMASDGVALGNEA